VVFWECIADLSGVRVSSCFRFYFLRLRFLFLTRFSGFINGDFDPLCRHDDPVGFGAGHFIAISIPLCSIELSFLGAPRVSSRFLFAKYDQKDPFRNWSNFDWNHSGGGGAGGAPVPPESGHRLSPIGDQGVYRSALHIK